MNHEIKLLSGAVLYITEAPFRVVEALNDAVMEEIQTLKKDMSVELDVNLVKDVLAKGLSSRRVKGAIWECMKRCTYDGVKICEATWEPTEARSDYFITCYHVAEKNLTPFLKDLASQFADIVPALVANILTSRSDPTTPSAS